MILSHTHFEMASRPKQETLSISRWSFRLVRVYATTQFIGLSGYRLCDYSVPSEGYTPEPAVSKTDTALSRTPKDVPSKKSYQNSGKTFCSVKAWVGLDNTRLKLQLFLPEPGFN